MKTVRLVIVAGLSLLSPAAPASLLETNLTRRNDLCPGHPPGVDGRSLCGNAFVNMKERGWSAAVASMPVFLFSRIDGHQVTCYPESAVVIGSNPPQMNPGTDVPSAIDPGEDCTDPGPYHGDMSQGDPFPVYVDGVYCAGDQTWRINYNLYYVHDGIDSGVGHKHDWEHVSVVWSRDGSGDWWKRSHALFSYHDHPHFYIWSQLETVDMDGSDNGNQDAGKSKNHPKAYVGMYKHPFFTDKDDDIKGIGSQGESYDYRSTDWYRLPQLSDVKWGMGEIPSNWNYGHASGTPSVVVNEICAENLA